VVSFSDNPTMSTAADWHRSLGGVALSRVLFDPIPSSATVQDVIRFVDGDEKRLVELVNGTLVEKPAGLRESVIASHVIHALGTVAALDRIGFISGEAGTITMRNGNVRMPDVAFFRREDLPGGKLPPEPAPQLAPALAVEVLSESNTDEEMRINVHEYFQSGVRIVWMLDPGTRTLRVYDAPDRFRQLTAEDMVDAGELLPDFAAKVSEFFEI
jgi:Uma2 family endonuclease